MNTTNSDTPPCPKSKPTSKNTRNNSLTTKAIRKKQNAAKRPPLKRKQRKSRATPIDGRTTSPIRARKPNGWGRAWTHKELAQVREWQEKGITQTEQARRLNRPLASIQSAVQRYKLGKHPHTNYDPDKRARLMALIEQGGYNQRALAAAIGDTSHTHVSIIIREFEARGIVTRKTRCSPIEVTKDWKAK